MFIARRLIREIVSNIVNRYYEKYGATNPNLEGLCYKISGDIVDELTVELTKKGYDFEVGTSHGVVLLPDEQRTVLDDMSREEFMNLPQHTWVWCRVGDMMYPHIDGCPRQFIEHFNGYKPFHLNTKYIVSICKAPWLLADSDNHKLIWFLYGTEEMKNEYGKGHLRFC